MSQVNGPFDIVRSASYALALGREWLTRVNPRMLFTFIGYVHISRGLFLSPGNLNLLTLSLSILSFDVICHTLCYISYLCYLSSMHITSFNISYFGS